MSHTRRRFFESTGVWAAGMAAAASSMQGQQPPGRGQAGRAGGPPQQDLGPPPRPASEIQVPKVNFFGTQISRLILGINPFGGGGGHHPDNLAGLMRDWYTTERQVAVMHQCNRFGINAWNGSGAGRSNSPIEIFKAEGGKLYSITQGGRVELGPQLKNAKPSAIYNMGEVVDVAFRENRMNDIREWCKQARQAGIPIGVGTHKPEVIDLVESQGWDVDFYAGCVYNRTRSDEEWRKILGGELMEMSREIYMQSDPPRMYKVMRQTKKPCIAFKIMGAGRVLPQYASRAFKLAFDSLKPTDTVMIGFCPSLRDEVREDAEIVCSLLQPS